MIFNRKKWSWKTGNRTHIIIIQIKTKATLKKRKKKERQ